MYLLPTRYVRIQTNTHLPVRMSVCVRITINEHVCVSMRRHRLLRMTTKILFSFVSRKPIMRSSVPNGPNIYLDRRHNSNTEVINVGKYLVLEGTCSRVIGHTYSYMKLKNFRKYRVHFH